MTATGTRTGNFRLVSGEIYLCIRAVSKAIYKNTQNLHIWRGDGTCLIKFTILERLKTLHDMVFFYLPSRYYFCDPFVYCFLDTTIRFSCQNWIFLDDA